MTESNSETQEHLEGKKNSWLWQSFNPFRIATLRGLGVVLPPLLTVMLFVWAWNTIDRAVLRPVESLSQTCLASSIEDIRDNAVVQAENSEATPPGSLLSNVDGIEVFRSSEGILFQEINNQWLPQEVVELVDQNRGEVALVSARDYYKRYVLSLIHI